MEYLLYGLEQGETRDYMETLLLVTYDLNKLNKTKEYALNNGWHSLRVASYNNEAPEFGANLLNRQLVK